MPFDKATAATGLLASKQYNPSTQVALSTTSTTFVAVDATNLAVTFTVPVSGKVLVRLSGSVSHNTGGGQVLWNLLSGGANVAGSAGLVMTAVVTGNYDFRTTHAVQITGLTPGAQLTWAWGWRVPSGTGRLLIGGNPVSASNGGPALLEVVAA